LLFRALRRRDIYRPRPGWLAFLAKLVIALGVLAGVLVAIAGPATLWLEASLWAKIGRLLWVCAAGAGVYFGALWLLGFRLADFNRKE
jgi:putative peptidoglycan lipid II flippase